MLPGKQHIGRRRRSARPRLDTLRRLVDKGVSVTEAARTLKIGRFATYDALRRDAGMATGFASGR